MHLSFLFEVTATRRTPTFTTDTDDGEEHTALENAAGSFPIGFHTNRDDATKDNE